MTKLDLDRARIRRLFDLRGEAYAERGGGYAGDIYSVFNALRESGPVHEHAPHEPLGWTGEVAFQGLPYAERRHFSVYDWAGCARVVVHVALGAATRDPARYERPDEFDPTRPQKASLGFGGGPHTCLGQHVARAEMVHGIGALLDRYPDLRLDPSAPAPNIIGIYERGPSSVPVILGRSA